LPVAGGHPHPALSRRARVLLWSSLSDKERVPFSSLSPWERLLQSPPSPLGRGFSVLLPLPLEEASPVSSLSLWERAGVRGV